MKKLWPVIWVFAALLSGAPADVVGRWRSLETSQGGIGFIMEFKPGGAMVYSPGAVVETVYRIEGQSLLLPPPAKSAPEQRMRMVWDGENRVSLRGEQNSGQTLTRVGTVADPHNLLLGEWTSTRETAGKKLEAHWLFYPSGKSLLLLPFVPKTGSWSVRDGNIRLQFAGDPVVAGPYQLEGEILTIPKQGGGSARLRRY